MGHTGGQLKSTNDPRLKVVSVVWVPGGGFYTPNNTAATQRGMVSGSINTKPTDFDSYSVPSLLYIDRGSPIITMGPAEAYLLLSEAQSCSRTPVFGCRATMS